MLVGAVSSVVAQVTAVWLMLGSSVFTAFATSLQMTLINVDALEAKPYMSHSLRAVTRLFPNWAGLPLWVALTGTVLWFTVKVWKSDAPLSVRLGVVILASVLVNPHLIVYDVTLLILPLVWFAAYVLEPERRGHAAAFGRTIYWLFAALFAPTATVIGLQASVPLMMGLFVWMARVATTAQSTSRYS